MENYCRHDGVSNLRRIAILMLLTAVLAICPDVSSAGTVNIEGRVFTSAGPLPGAMVLVFRNYQDLAGNQPFLTSEPTDLQGYYKLQLEPGEYYFTAKGKYDGKNYSAFHGNNPIGVDKVNLWVVLLANEEKPAAYSEGVTSLQGIITYKGEPVQGATVAVYTLDSRKFKGLGFLAEKGIGFMKAADSDGSFNFPLSPGNYVIIARKTDEERVIRPLKSGDLYCYTPVNPIEIRPDQAVRIEVPCYPKGDRQSFVDTARIKTNDYLTVDKSEERMKYGIKGRLTNGKGEPLKGVYVVAYRADDPSMITSEAQSVTLTDEKGNYFIRLEAEGQYGLVVRETLGGAPNLNQIAGVYGLANRDPWKGVFYKAGELIEGIDISIDEDRPMIFK